MWIMRRITEKLWRSLRAFFKAVRPGGWLVFEIGWQQQEAVEAIGKAAGWCNVSCRKDYGGNPRAVSLQKPETK